MTKEELIATGVDYEKGLALCMNNEAFYFKMIKKGLANEKFELLKEHLEQKKLDAAFEDAHALKGIAGNLHFTKLFSAIERIVEPLRNRDTSQDYDALYNELFCELEKLRAVAKD